MESRRHLLLLALLVSSTLALANATSIPELDPSATKAVHDICGVTTYKVVCLSAARVFAKDYNLVISKDTMMEMHIKLGISRTRAAKAAAERLKRKLALSASGPITAVGLNSCIDRYDDMLSDFDTALTSLKSGDQGTTMTYLSAMFPNVGACDGEFDVHKEKNPLASKNMILRRISSNALAIGRSKWHILI